MAILTAQKDTRAGSGTIEVEHSSFTASTGFEVYSIGELSVAFDLTEDGDASSIYFAPTEFKFEAGTQLDNGDSFFTYIDNVPAGEDIEVRLNFTTDAGTTINDSYKFRASDVKYRAIQRKLVIESRIDASSDDTVNDIITNNPSDVYDYSAEFGDLYDAMPVRDFIENTLTSINPNNTYINRTTLFGENPFIDGKYSWIVPESLSYVASEDDATQVLYRLASVDGSVVGSIMGYNFIRNRLDKTTTVTITADEVEDYKVGFGTVNYRSLKMSVRRYTIMETENAYGSWSLITGLAGNGDGLNDSGSKELSVFFNLREVQSCEWDSTNSRFEEVATALSTDIADAPIGDLTADVEQGTYSITITDDSPPSISVGDMVALNGYKTRDFHIVRKIVTHDNGDRSLVFWTPLVDSHDSGTTVYTYLASPAVNDSDFYDMVDTAINGYAHAYGGNGARNIEFTIWDVDKVPPYAIIQTDDSFVEEVIHFSEFSPSKITYNIETDKIVFKGYDITNA